MSFIEPDWPAAARVGALVSTRRGGVSAPPYDTFNLAGHVGDDELAVAENRERLAQVLPAGLRTQWLDQVHGTTVVAAGSGDTPSADACWTDQAGLACAVMTADCLPVLFSCRGGRVVAAAHAGWRGLCAGVLEATVAALPVAPSDLLAWLGPAIGPSAFEVGPEVREAFIAAGDAPAVSACFRENTGRAGHFYADLYALARLRLNTLGVGAVYGGGECTYRDQERFFSYRRDGQTGRMASLIYLKPL